MNNSEILKVAIKASVEAGKILMQNFEKNNSSFKIKESLRDISTEIDTMAENTIIKILKNFDDEITIYTEEQGLVNDKSKNKYWIIDALDGTVNYINRIPFFCVSIAFVKDDKVETSAIFVPYFNDLYFAARGIGSFKNHQALKVGDCNFSDSLFAVSFSGKNHEPKIRKKEFELLGEVNDSSRGCLRTGSAALNLALLAEGSFDGCWGKANKYWDIAAGLLIAELAGNKLKKKMISKDNFLCSFIISKPSILKEITNKVQSKLKLF